MNSVRPPEVSRPVCLHIIAWRSITSLNSFTTSLKSNVIVKIRLNLEQSSARLTKTSTAVRAQGRETLPHSSPISHSSRHSTKQPPLFTTEYCLLSFRVQRPAARGSCWSSVHYLRFKFTTSSSHPTNGTNRWIMDVRHSACQLAILVLQVGSQFLTLAQSCSWIDSTRLEARRRRNRMFRSINANVSQ